MAHTGATRLVLTGIFASVLALMGDPALPILWLAPLFAVAGAGRAAGSLLLARRVEDQDALTSDPDLSEAALTEAEELEQNGAHEKRFPEPLRS